MSVLENKFLKSKNRISYFIIPETSSDMEHFLRRWRNRYRKKPIWIFTMNE